MTTDSHVEISDHATTYVGKDATLFVRAIALKSALNLYAKTKIQMARNASPTRMLAMATEFTGKKYKRGQYAIAAADVEVWITNMRTALPVVDSRKPK